MKKTYTPGYFFKSTVILIFMAEVFVMLILPALPELPHYSEVIIDSAILCIIVIPLLYVMLFKPMVEYIAERDAAEGAILVAQRDLESRVEKRTKAFEEANKTLHDEYLKHESTRTRLEYLLSATPSVIYTSKAEGDYATTFISDNIREQLGHDPRDFINNPGFWAEGIHPEDRERVLNELSELFEKGEYVHEYRFRHKDGSYRWLHDKLRLVKDDEGNPHEIVGSWIDITGRVQLEEELRATATIDKLTNTYNRSKFEEIVSLEMERSKRYVHPLSMLLFDIDKFKEINDTKGHLVGDEAIKAVAEVAKSHMRMTNYLVRWGGDEFIILPVETELDGARILADRIRQSIELHDFGEAGKITVSFGIAMFKDDDTEDSFLKRADDALYKAKEQGGNCVVHG
jgi:diguanylate cyclase (GGDEF)-like protein/PAS domain S-box-containing protein